ncbi:MAG: HAMP domain-containing sensor histidine kinase [Polyangiales bacterium]
MAARRLRSISTPIVLAAISVPLSIALLVGWMWVVIENLSLTQQVTQNTLLMVLGGLFFVVIMGVLITFSVYLAREIQEVRRQDSFIDSVTHELKSPLASLRLCLETLGRAELETKQREELRQMMFDDVERLSSFIDDVLHASRLAADRVGMSVSDVNVREVVEASADTVAARHHVDRSSIHIEVPEVVRLATDETALAVVIRNLLDNAVKYSPEPIHVTVRAGVDGDSLELTVVDRGIGIPTNELKRVFQRFFRVSSEDVRSRKGTGIGLFVVAALVRNLGGTVRAESPGQGLGTAMHVRLPLRGRQNSVEAA